MADLDSKMDDIRVKMTRERKMMDAAQAMKRASTNEDVRNDCDKRLRESATNMGYFQNLLLELERRASTASLASSSSFPSDSTPPTSVSGSSYKNRALPTPPGPPGRPGMNPGRQSDESSMHSNRTRQSEAKSSTSPLPPAPKIHYSNLDLIKADTPLTTAKISRMLHQLDFKLTVEKQYKEGIDKMAKLYQTDGDKKSRQDAESKRLESNQKLQLLNQAIKKYKSLDIMGDESDEDEEDDPADRKGNLRKPLTGTLYVSVIQARDLDRPVTASRFGRSTKRNVESVVVIKVEDTPRARTHPSRTGSWAENFEIHVDKANEVEVTIYDKAANEVPIPMGLLWIRLSDVAEELRKKRVGQEGAGPGWVTANRIEGQASPQDSPFGSSDAQDSSQMRPGSQPAGYGANSSQIVPNPSSPEGLSAWFAVEPEGQIQLQLNFVKSNVRKRPFDAAGGLGRQGAVRKRKEEVHEQNGHKFVQKQFYTVILCAYCREFLLNAVGMQCEDCKYMCHKKCFTNVVTKCITKSNAETDKDEEKINHRIPHRFEPISSLSPSWCCHCGLILPLGRKKARKCSECDLTAHTDCVHLVPDFCGMSMEMANQLLREVKSINITKSRQSLPHTQSHTHSYSHSHSQSYGGSAAQQPPAFTPSASETALTDGTGRLRLEPSGPQRMPPPLESQMQQSQPSTQPYGQQGPPAPMPEQTAYNPQYRSPGSQRPPSVTTSNQTSQQGQRFSSQPNPVDPRFAGPNSMPPGAFDPRASQQQNASPQPSRTSLPSQGRPGQYGPNGPSTSDPRIPAYQQPSQAQMAPQQPQSKPMPGQGHPQQQQMSSYNQGQVPRPQQMTDNRRASQRPQAKRKIGLDDFNFLAVLGKGNFGKVMLAEEKASAKLYAIKVLKKDFIIENDEIESTKSEKRVFIVAAKERHPFLLGLHSCFQTETRIYFCMEYIPGGDLMLHIQRKQFSPKQAKFYGAEVLLALEYFHANGIVYRDLKLDNILLTLDGHVKVADYGLCKEEMWYGKTTSTFCGTPEFMAPEILLEQRYDRAVDWWAFGVLIYEMLLGQSPFRGEDEDEIFDAILEDEPLYPIHMPRDSVSILQKLLTRDPKRRLGSGESDAYEIKRHAFFKDMNWDDLFHKRIPPPFMPNVGSATDVSNFDSEFTGEAPRLTPVHSRLSAADQREFESFSWVAPWVNGSA